MTPPRRGGSGGWRAWVACSALLAALGALFVAYREVLAQRQAPVALSFLLVVLLGSVAGGQALGTTLALAGFLVLNYFFQRPYFRFGVVDPADWVVLATYLVVAYVAARLVVRAHAEAEAARRRAAEVQRLADLGAETLSAGRADEALQAIADVIARTLRLDRCEVWKVADDGAATRLAAFPPDGASGAGPERIGADGGGELAARVRASAAQGAARGAGDRARWPVAALAGAPADVLVPLGVHRRTAGALRLVRAGGLALDDAGRAFLEALAHYAALGVERVRLEADAERGEALREADRLKDFVLATVSHDLRTPLTTIKALAHERAVAGDRGAAVIEEQADRLTRLVSDVLDLSRARAGALPLSLELNTAEDVVGAALRQADGVLGGRRVEPRFRVEGGPLVGRFDFVATLRVLGNLLENAAKYSPAGSAIALDVVRDGAELAFAVGDRGRGVAEGERERIFAPFHRAADAPPDAGGAGLGLAVARALAAAQHGSVDHAPRPGGGSVFTLRVPASDDAYALALIGAGDDAPPAPGPP